MASVVSVAPGCRLGHSSLHPAGLRYTSRQWHVNISKLSWLQGISSLEISTNSGLAHTVWGLTAGEITWLAPKSLRGQPSSVSASRSGATGENSACWVLSLALTVNQTWELKRHIIEPSSQVNLVNESYPIIPMYGPQRWGDLTSREGGASSAAGASVKQDTPKGWGVPGPRASHTALQTWPDPGPLSVATPMPLNRERHWIHSNSLGRKFQLCVNFCP